MFANVDLYINVINNTICCLLYIFRILKNSTISIDIYKKIVYYNKFYIKKD